MLVFIFFRQDRTYRIHGWCIATREAEKTDSTSNVLWWSVCSVADSDGCILLTANAEMLNMVYKTNYSSACSCRLLSITFFFAETDRHPARKRKTCIYIYTDTMQSRNTTVKNLSFIKRAEQTNSSTTICSHTLTKISFAFLSLLSFAFTLLSHFTFSILEPSVLRSPHFAFQHRTTKSPQYIYIYILSSPSLALKWSTSAHILVVEWKNHFFFFFFSSSSPSFVSSDLRPSLPVSYLNLKRIED